jgi:anti-sigma factor RsiW
MKYQRQHGVEREISCADAIALVVAYLEDELQLADRHRFEAHLARCAECVEHVKQIHTAIAWAGRVREVDLDVQARTDLVELRQRWSQPETMLR